MIGIGKISAEGSVASLGEALRDHRHDVVLFVRELQALPDVREGRPVLEGRVLALSHRPPPRRAALLAGLQPRRTRNRSLLPATLTNRGHLLLRRPSGPRGRPRATNALPFLFLSGSDLLA